MSKKIVIGGSMKCRDIIKNTMSRLRDLGFEPLFPNIDYSLENKDVAKDEKTKEKLSWEHYRAIDEADAVYFILPNGYMGTSCKIELGYAIALRKPVYFSEKTGDIGIDCCCNKIISLDGLGLLKEEIK